MAVGHWSLDVAVGRCPWLSVVGHCRSSLSVIVVTAIVTLPVVGAAPSMAEDTASVEPAGGAEKAPLPDLRHGIWWGREGWGILRWHTAKMSREGWVSASVGTHSNCMLAAVQMDHAGHCGQEVSQWSDKKSTHKFKLETPEGGASQTQTDRK